MEASGLHSIITEYKGRSDRICEECVETAAYILGMNIC